MHAIAWGKIDLLLLRVPPMNAVWDRAQAVTPSLKPNNNVTGEAMAVGGMF